MPLLVVCLSLLALVTVLAVREASSFLEAQLDALPWISIAVSGILPLLFLVWYFTSYASVRQGLLTVHSFRSRHQVDLRTLVEAEVYSRTSRSKRKPHELMLRLVDAGGRELWLPLNSWRDEDLLMARVLRATVERKVRIDGDPMLVRRFSGLLATYKSWDRRQGRTAA